MGTGFIKQIVYSNQLVDASLHKHNLYQMLFIRKGTVKLTVSGQSYLITEPSVVFISNLESHSFAVCSEVYERYAFYINPKAMHIQLKSPTLCSIFSNRPQGFHHIVPVKPIFSHIDSLIQLLFRENNQPQHPFSDYENMLFKSLLILLYQFAPDRFSYMDEGVAGIVWSIKQELEQNAGQELSLEHLAERYHFSYCYLSRSFKKITGYSIKQYQILCRISYAKELLAHSGISITEVSQQCGFSDTSNFTRYFKTITGLTPTNYRNENVTRQKTGGQL